MVLIRSSTVVLSIFIGHRDYQMVFHAQLSVNFLIAQGIAKDPSSCYVRDYFSEIEGVLVQNLG